MFVAVPIQNTAWLSLLRCSVPRSWGTLGIIVRHLADKFDQLPHSRIS